MSFSPGARLGPYEVLSSLGAGGMGEVYRARDTTLHRDVALKVLPDAFASDPDRLARFEREAQLLASLSHPNIAAIYGIQDRALVLELVEGPTLADRIAGGPFTVEDAVPIARQIVDALDAAHERGVIHRDLKPSNIKVRPDGTVKVLDFGLAKALDSAPGSVHVSQSPTITSPAMTRAGVVLGTAAYMSPEQARGRAADTRSDVWAFGCVLFEMLTGRRAFEGDEVSDTMASVLRAEPAWAALPDRTPASLRRLLRRCLEKDLKRRLAHVGDARLELDDALTEEAPASAAPSSRSKWRERIAWAIATLALVAGAVVIGRRVADPVSIQASQFSILPPNSATLTSSTTVAISRDGRWLAFTASSAGGPPRLWVRPLNSLSARLIEGTEWATMPFWSPDAKSIGFFAEGKLKRVDAAGGGLRSLADVSFPLGGSWNENNVILFAPGFGQPILRIAASGGPTTAVTTRTTASVEVHASPTFLADNQHFLFSMTRGPYDHEIYVGSLDNQESRRLAHSETGAVLSTGFLLLVQNGVLAAQPFDERQMTTSGDAVPVHESAVLTGGAPFSASDTGTLIYRQSTTTESQIVWVDRNGKRLGTAAPPGLYDDPAMSPDGKRLAFARTNVTGADVWVHDLERGITSRLTFSAPFNNVPIWSADGSTIAFATWKTGRGLDLYQRPSNPAGADQELLPLNGQPIIFPSDWSRDGRFITYYRTNLETQLDTWILPLVGDRKPYALLASRFNESQGQFSPDGKWIAYVSDESGGPQVYVQPFPMATTKVQISASGGTQPRWRRDGRELFYVAADGTLMAVDVGAGGTFANAARPLFRTQLQLSALRQSYDVTADGTRFLLYEAPVGAAPVLTAVLNWPALLRK